MTLDQFMAQAYRDAEEYGAGVSRQAEDLARAAWECQQAAYNAVCEERDAIVQDNDKAHALLRQALAALNAAINAVMNDQPYLTQCKASAAAIKEFLK